MIYIQTHMHIQPNPITHRLLLPITDLLALGMD